MKSLKEIPCPYDRQATRCVVCGQPIGEDGSYDIATNKGWCEEHEREMRVIKFWENLKREIGDG